MLLLDRLADLHDTIAAIDDGRLFFEKLLDYLEIEPRISVADLERIPKSGPVVAVANHPFGFIEGAILGAVLPKVRPDLRIMANSLLGAFPAASDAFILVNPFGTADAKRQNGKGLKETLELLKSGGMLAVFPAGEVAHIDLRERAVVDPEWSPTIARLVRSTNATVVPMFFAGANSALFQLLGFLHPRVRTAMLPHELLNKQKHSIELRVGQPISFSRLKDIPSDEDMIAALRRRTYLLRHREPVKHWSLPLPFFRKRERTIEPVPPKTLEAEIAALPSDRKLAEMNELEVWYGAAHELPQTLRELGRLREVTFRSVGEGTGKSLDLDSFDAHYLHLFLWNRESREVVGAYRLGRTDAIRRSIGPKGLYTRTLFDYDDRLLDKLGDALEVGRSFVRAEYQKSYAPLLLLWKGIGEFIVRHPGYGVLFGPVSISNDYKPISRQLMVAYFDECERDPNLASLVKARSPFRRKPSRESERIAAWDIEDLTAAIGDIETDQKGVPVLIRQYLKLGGKLVAFNVDHRFADALDGLIVVDLRKTDRRTLDRYLGKEGAGSFLIHHRSKTAQSV